MLAHTLGNPHLVTLGLPEIEDCCDALGSRIYSDHVGGDSHISTCSFFPAHHITTGEGGAVFSNNPLPADVITIASFTARYVVLFIPVNEKVVDVTDDD